MHMIDRIEAWKNLHSEVAMLLQLSKTLTEMLVPEEAPAQKINQMLKDQMERTQEALDNSRSAFTGEES